MRASFEQIRLGKLGRFALQRGSELQRIALPVHGQHVVHPAGLRQARRGLQFKRFFPRRLGQALLAQRAVHPRKADVSAGRTRRQPGDLAEGADRAF